VAATRDSRHVGRHDDEKLRRFLAARRAGDEGEMRRWWDALVSDNFDRVCAMVALQSRGHLSRDEQEEAVQRALIKLLNNMIVTFKGSSVGEWVESTRTLVKFACIDTQRREQAISKHERSLDRAAGRNDDDDDAADRDGDVYEAIEKQRREQESAEHDADVLGERRSFLDWAVPQLSDKRREVIELDRAEVPVDEIQQRLGVSRDVVYQSRHRALKDLANLREAYGS
jgi:RNA polymerase sigma factor (sigma-70 family)